MSIFIIVVVPPGPVRLLGNSPELKIGPVLVSAWVVGRSGRSRCQRLLPTGREEASLTSELDHRTIAQQGWQKGIDTRTLIRNDNLYF